MAGWYNSIVKDISVLPDVINHFETELVIARDEDLAMKGRQIERIAADIPSIVEHRYGQLQEIEAILEFLNIELRKTRSKVFRRYLENYQRALSSRDVEKYVDGDDEVVDMAVLINQFGLLRNQWLGLVKAIDQKSFSVNNIVRLRVAGLDDATL
jgi:hypothetical protein